MTNRIGSSLVGKTLSVILALIILGSIALLGYNVTFPPVTEEFTEFYVLNSKGIADDYPQVLTLGQEGKVIVGIVNREQKTESYRVEVRMNQAKPSELGPLVLEQGETRQETILFRPVVAGNDQKLEFRLYKSGQTDVYRSVYLLVSVGLPN